MDNRVVGGVFFLCGESWRILRDCLGQSGPLRNWYILWKGEMPRTRSGYVWSWHCRGEVMVWSVFPEGKSGAIYFCCFSCCYSCFCLLLCVVCLLVDTARVKSLAPYNRRYFSDHGLCSTVSNYQRAVLFGRRMHNFWSWLYQNTG